MTTSDVQAFYDAMAENYHLIFADWEQSVQRQGRIIDKLMRAELNSPVEPITLLDCACGIGTQAIGLALQGGYKIHATDISPVEIERAKVEAEKAGVEMSFGVADMRTLVEDGGSQFEAVIAFDNAMPHLLTAEDLDLALRNIHGKLRPDGIFMASIRDYDALLNDQPQLTSQRVIETETGKRITLQLWEWEGEIYTVNQFILQQASFTWQMNHYTTQYWALRRDIFTAALQQVGFSAIKWLMPDESDYYQPIVVAQK